MVTNNPGVRPGARTVIHPEGTPKPVQAYSPAVAAGGWVFASGQFASDFVHGVAPEARNADGNPYLRDPLELQARYILSNLSRTLEAAGADISTDVARIYQWLVSPHPTPEEFEDGSNWTGLCVAPYLRTLNGEFLTRRRPASTAMGVRNLLARGALVEVDLIAIPARDGVVREDVGAPDGVPAPPGGYSPGTRIGDWVFLAGELPADWVGDYGRSDHHGDPSALAIEARTNPYYWYDAPIERQTDYTLQKLERTARAAGSSLDRCVKATVYLGHPSDFAGMDRVWRQWFPNHPPARVVVPYMGLAGRGCRLEVSLVLLHESSSLEMEAIESDDALPPFGHEPQAVKAGNFLFFSTQFAGLGGGLRPPLCRDREFPWYGEVTRAQVEYVLENVDKICRTAGTTLSNIVRRQCFHEDFDDFAEESAAWLEHFAEGEAPASTTIEVGGPLLVPGCKVLFDLIGYVP